MLKKIILRWTRTRSKLRTRTHNIFWTRTGVQTQVRIRVLVLSLSGQVSFFVRPASKMWFGMRNSASRILVDRYSFQTIWLVWFDNMMVRLKVFPVKFRADYFPIHFLLKTVMTECPNKLINKSLLHVKAKRKGNNTNISKLSESITFFNHNQHHNKSQMVWNWWSIMVLLCMISEQNVKRIFCPIYSKS